MNMSQLVRTPCRMVNRNIWTVCIANIWLHPKRSSHFAYSQQHFPYGNDQYIDAMLSFIISNVAAQTGAGPDASDASDASEAGDASEASDASEVLLLVWGVPVSFWSVPSQTSHKIKTGLNSSQQILSRRGVLVKRACPPAVSLDVWSVYPTSH